MGSTVTVNEKFSNYWITALYLSSGTALLTFILFWNINDVLWSGIMRLIAFIAFAVSIFCLLKVMEGKKSMKITKTDDALHVTYLKGKSVIQEDSVSISNIKYIYRRSYDYYIPVFDLSIGLADSYSFIIRLRDSADDYYLFEFGGRGLHLGKKAGKRLKSFFEDHNLYKSPDNQQ